MKKNNPRKSGSYLLVFSLCILYGCFKTHKNPKPDIFPLVIVSISKTAFDNYAEYFIVIANGQTISFHDSIGKFVVSDTVHFSKCNN